jgi:hypothetical protein
MNPTNLTRSSSADLLSRIGGAAQGGSAKPPQEREKLDRERGVEEEQSTPSAAEDTERPGTLGGNSNDSRTDEERSSQAGERR